MENDLKGNENYFELTGGSSYRQSTVNIKSCNVKRRRQRESTPGNSNPR